MAITNNLKAIRTKQHITPYKDNMIKKYEDLKEYFFNHEITSNKKITLI